MKRTVFLLIVSAVLALGLNAQGAQGTQTGGWKLDKAHSNATFSIRHMVISEVTGKFTDFDITVNAAKDDFTDGILEATIKVASINTENASRDRHLQTDDFFNAEKFPVITFKSTSVEKVGENTYKFNGDLTIRDVTKPVTFEAVHNGVLRTSRGMMSAWKATLSLNRFDFGLKWNKTVESGGLVAGETVTIILTLEFNKPNS